MGTPWQEIENFIQDRKVWIERKQAEFRACYSKIDYQYIDGEIHYFLGQPYCLKVYSANNNQVLLKEKEGEKGKLDLGVHALSSPESALYAWYRDQAKVIFIARYDYWLKQAQEKLMVDSGLDLKLVVKRLKSRWGSYSTRGRINLNLELIRYPQSCLDMIVCHELCHVRELKHNKKFFNHLSYLYPDWQAQSQLLLRLSMMY